MAYRSSGLEVAAGGTGVLTTTAYGVLCGGTTATGAFQNAGAGGSGQILVSGGAAALPSFVSAASSGAALKLISSQTASNSATISFTGLSAAGYLLVLTGVQPVTNTASLRMVVSSNNGSSYANTGYLGNTNYSAYNLATILNTNSTTFFPISGPVSSSGIYSSTFSILNINVGNGTIIGGNASWNDTTLVTAGVGYIGGIGPTGTNAIQFAFSSGNINSGVFSIYQYSVA